MFLGLLFLKRSDKQAWFRYIVMIVAIMLSMAMLLSSVAIGNAASKQIDRNAWHQNIFSYSDRDGVSDALDPASQKTILELNHTYFNQDFKQYSIQELGIRQISSDSPLPPNLARQPEADEIFVSQSLLNLINSHPTLKERYADYKISLGVPDDLLTSPDNNLLIYRISDEKINHSFNHHNDFATFGHEDLSKLSSSFLLCASAWSSASSAMLHSALSVPVSVKSTKSSYLKLYLAHSLVYFPVLAFTSFFASPFSVIFVLVAIDSSLKTFPSLHLVFSTSLYSFLPSPF